MYPMKNLAWDCSPTSLTLIFDLVYDLLSNSYIGFEKFSFLNETSLDHGSCHTDVSCQDFGWDCSPASSTSET